MSKNEGENKGAKLRLKNQGNEWQKAKHIKASWWSIKLAEY